MTIASISPPIFHQGQTTPFTLTGTGFTPDTVISSNGGVSISDVVYVDDTCMTGVFHAPRTIGSRSVTATNSQESAGITVTITF